MGREGLVAVDPEQAIGEVGALPQGVALDLERDLGVVDGVAVEARADLLHAAVEERLARVLRRVEVDRGARNGEHVDPALEDGVAHPRLPSVLAGALARLGRELGLLGVGV